MQAGHSGETSRLKSLEGDLLYHSFFLMLAGAYE